MTDEQNLRTIGAYRDLMSNEQAFQWGQNVFVDTPNIDRLANEGVIFDNFYAVTPLCTPSRASFMTGLYPKQTGAWKNHGTLKKNKHSFAEDLMDTHDTVYLGKWHLNGVTKDSTDFNNNPNRKFGFKNTSFQYNRGHWKYFSQEKWKVTAYDWSQRGMFANNEEQNYATDFLFDKAISFMKNKKDKGKNFAVMLSIADPHAPNEVRAPYNEMYNHISFQLPSTGKKAMRLNPALPDWGQVDTFSPETAESNISDWENDTVLQKGMQNVFGMIKLIDDNVGKMLQFFDDENLADDTIVIFTSDHGDMMGEHGRLNKGVPYKASAQVPMIMRWPNKIDSGKIIKTAYSSVDFAPSLLGMMSVEAKNINSSGIDGSSEIMRSGQISFNEEQIRFLTDSKMKRWAAAITGQYKLVLSKDGPWLFDMIKDPDEMINYYEDPKYTQLASTLKNALIDTIDKFNFPLKQRSYLADTPECWDSKNEISGWDNNLCSDLNDIQNRPACQWDFVSSQCPRVCGECCHDSSGEFWLFKAMEPVLKYKKKSDFANTLQHNYFVLNPVVYAETDKLHL
eukprot:CAMPEP_0194072332 /NCGR_PEP_ID=MMETSP0149-20130528/98_1 /TAXON_ID=122233 /ORGANISM="Chaetoceros debilis, Strain MM31A-1" /LENGTH=565 /DNA_ID=CAMNT_0038752199 /DNA_START=177 /DNA_END=1875 /DNA_ORIENTATION=+